MPRAAAFEQDSVPAVILLAPVKLLVPERVNVLDHVLVNPPAPLTLPLQELQLLEGQDMVLASLKNLGSGQIWSPRLGEFRPLAPSLQCAIERLRFGAAKP